MTSAPSDPDWRMALNAACPGVSRNGMLGQVLNILDLSSALFDCVNGARMDVDINMDTFHATFTMSSDAFLDIKASIALD